MPNIERERGMSIIGVLLLVAVAGVLGITALKLIPIYLESFKIDKALQGVIEESDVGIQTKGAIAKALVRRFDIDDVTRISEGDFKDYVTISKDGDAVSIAVSYRAETTLFGNLSIAADFDKHVEN